MTIHKLFTPEPTCIGGAVHFSIFNTVQNKLVPPTFKHYLLLPKSTEFTAFGRVLANSANFVPVNIQNS